jgi:hypothetical protein
LAVAVSAGCRQSSPPQLKQDRWSWVTTDAGVVEIPPGWDIWVTAKTDILFRIYGPMPEIEVWVVNVPQSGIPADRALQRVLTNMSVAHGVVLQVDEFGHHYGESVRQGDRIFAACGWHSGKANRLMLAFTYALGDGPPTRTAYNALGGRAMLCRIAASVREAPSPE